MWNHVFPEFFRVSVNISAQNARRFVAEVYLSIVETLRGVLKNVVDSSQGLKMFWWNEDLWTCPSNGKNIWGSECTGVTHYSSANHRFWRPGFGAGVYADEDNEEDISRTAEMFEAASILSAMEVLFFLFRSPVCVCLKRCFPFSAYCMCVCLDGFVCNTCWM